jgi:hypothetical protein
LWELVLITIYAVTVILYWQKKSMKVNLMI